MLPPKTQTPAPVRTPGKGRLCLRRRLGESIIITLPDGQLVTLTVGADRGSQVRLDFEAPSAVVIDRKEVWDQKQYDAMQRGTP